MTSAIYCSPRLISEAPYFGSHVQTTHVYVFMYSAPVGFSDKYNLMFYPFNF